MVDAVAYQLIVTRRGTDPRSGEQPPNEWEFSNPRFNGQKRNEIGALAIDLDLAEIWLDPSLVNAPSCQGFHHFDRLFTLPSRHDWASVPPPQTAPS
jgi:hypothetical protein